MTLSKCSAEDPTIAFYKVQYNIGPIFHWTYYILDQYSTGPIFFWTNILLDQSSIGPTKIGQKGLDQSSLDQK